MQGIIIICLIIPTVVGKTIVKRKTDLRRFGINPRLPPENVANHPGRPLSDQDRSRAARLEVIEPTPYEMDAIEMSGLFQGDMAGLSHSKMKQMVAEEKAIFGTGPLGDDIGAMNAMKNALRDQAKLWPEGRVPYVISDAFNDDERARISKAMQEIEDKTCIRFEPAKDSDKFFVFIQAKSGCYSYVGVSKKFRNTGQTISLQRGYCAQIHGIILHELMHSLGFYHEQARADRDQYVSIEYENMQKGNEVNFKKYNIRQIKYLGTEYDYGSIMHYRSHSFSKNGKPTIIKLDKADTTKIGQRVRLSETDVLKINRLYQCKQADECYDKIGVNVCRTIRNEKNCKKQDYLSFTMEECFKTCHHCNERKRRRFLARKSKRGRAKN